LALYTPTEVKAAVTGNGRADKAQVTAMVTRILRLETPPKPADAADALALAICQVWCGGAQNRLQQAVTAQRTARQTPRKQTSGEQTSGQEHAVEQTPRQQTARAGSR
ncbi:MAG TPA: crossover junction endodeoxyribonuclease RuvC, partial [Dermatophilaceae bacterium]|nr:crossover junction endodeoxyribonuclease RuvC [Dermatophilaceae bacterium]